MVQREKEKKQVCIYEVTRLTGSKGGSMKENEHSGTTGQRVWP